MERSTKILVALLLILAAVTIVAIVAPGAVINFAEGTIIAPVIGAFVGMVEWLDGFRASYLLAAGLVGGLVLAVLIKRVDIPKRIRFATGKPATTPTYQGAPSYTPPTVVSQPNPVATQPVVQETNKE